MMHRMNLLLLSLVFLFGRVGSLRHELDAGPPRGLAQQPGLLEVFQVNRPPLAPQEFSGATSCTIALMNHNFGNSAGAPFQGSYSPDCGVDWAVAVLNLSVVSYGRQFDRLGSVWIGDTEVWRTCTAEPTWSGIHFGYAKDITAFASLLNVPQPIVVNIDNHIVGPYNGTFNATLSIVFYNISMISPRYRAADEIVSISKIVSGGPNTYYSLPYDTAAVLLSIPQNTTRVILDILASGNANEEFWYSNVPNPYVDTLQKWNISLLGQGTFREIIVSVDGNPVAAAWPFEVVFTGGISPAFWRPIVDYRTFDLPSYRFDLTSLLPLLRNGTHQICLDVLGQPTTLENWYITGQIHLWHANAEHSNNSMQGADYFISPRANLTTSAQIAADNSSFEVHTSASRQNQLYTVDYNNIQNSIILGNGSMIVQNLTQTTFFGSPLSSGHFILSLDTVQVDYANGSIYLQAALNQTFYRITPNALTGLYEVEHAVVTTTSWFVMKEDGNVGSGNTSVTLNFLSPHRQYVRDVRAVEFQVTYDYESDNPIEFVQES